MPVEASLGSHVEKRLTVADVPALGEVGPERLGRRPGRASQGKATAHR
jgi:hypothetical protein